MSLIDGSTMLADAFFPDFSATMSTSHRATNILEIIINQISNQNRQQQITHIDEYGPRNEQVNQHAQTCNLEQIDDASEGIEIVIHLYDYRHDHYQGEPNQGYQHRHDGR